MALDPAPPSGFSGAAVIDAQGQFVGLAGLKAASTASLVSAAAIRKFLEGAKVEPASGGTSIDAAKASVMRVICVGNNAPIRTLTVHSPVLIRVNFGGRFSTNAAMPSF